MRHPRLYILFDCGLFLFEYLTAEQDDIHYRKEGKKDAQCQVGLLGRQRCQQHQGEAKDNGREILIHQIIGGREAELTPSRKLKPKITDFIPGSRLPSRQ